MTNLADNVLSIEKPNIRITKNRDFGITNLIECSYDPATRRVFQTNIGDRSVYGWNHEGITAPEFPASSLPEFAISGSDSGEKPY